MTTTADSPAVAAVDADAGLAYAQLIADQLAEERSRKSSLEARGVTVITTAGPLATLLFALTAGLDLKGHQTCRFLVLFAARTAASMSRWTPLARRIAITVQAACGPGTLIATCRATVRLTARAASSR